MVADLWSCRAQSRNGATHLDCSQGKSDDGFEGMPKMLHGNSLNADVPS
jgi:hypothetical protein